MPDFSLQNFGDLLPVFPDRPEAEKAAHRVRMTEDMQSLKEERDTMVAELAAAHSDASAKVEFERRLIDQEQLLMAAEAAAVAARSETETSRAAAEKRKETGLRRCILRNTFRVQALAWDGWRAGVQVAGRAGTR